MQETIYQDNILHFVLTLFFLLQPPLPEKVTSLLFLSTEVFSLSFKYIVSVKALFIRYFGGGCTKSSESNVYLMLMLHLVPTSHVLSAQYLKLESFV